MTEYSITTDARFGALERMDVFALADAVTDPWHNQTLCSVDDSVVRLGVVQGEFHWHKHDDEDEFFFVVDGELVVELEDRTVELRAGQGVTVPKGVVHRPVAPRRTIMLMVERKGVRPTGD
jgi:mannose-6-phosphate isomerase-like protein (cupin superfamily)